MRQPSSCPAWGAPGTKPASDGALGAGGGGRRSGGLPQSCEWMGAGAPTSVQEGGDGWGEGRYFCGTRSKTPARYVVCCRTSCPPGRQVAVGGASAALQPPLVHTCSGLGVSPCVSSPPTDHWLPDLGPRGAPSPSSSHSSCVSQGLPGAEEALAPPVSPLLSP